MNINDLIAILKKKLEDNFVIENINIEDKSFLHKKHKSYQEGKFHLKLNIKSIELSKLSRIQSSKMIFKVLDQEIKEHIHSLQILIG
jgi:BolA protein